MRKRRYTITICFPLSYDDNREVAINLIELWAKRMIATLSVVFGLDEKDVEETIFVDD